jgi:hypothetical protein
MVRFVGGELVRIDAQKFSSVALIVNTPPRRNGDGLMPIALALNFTNDSFFAEQSMVVAFLNPNAPTNPAPMSFWRCGTVPANGLQNKTFCRDKACFSILLQTSSYDGRTSDKNGKVSTIRLGWTQCLHWRCCCQCRTSGKSLRRNTKCQSRLLRPVVGQRATSSFRQIGTAPQGIASFGKDGRGEIYVVGMKAWFTNWT